MFPACERGRLMTLYKAEDGVRYARAFALHAMVPEAERLFYYSSGDNCTNFISQCVWAAYGGWLSYAPTAVNASRIRQNVRMVSNVWYGSFWHVGSPDWCRVEAFYTDVTAAKGNGPAARQIAAGTFDTVDPGILRRGDVVQLVVRTYVPDRFGHGLYVTEPGEDWETVRICCQSYDRLDASASEFSQYPSIYTRLRVLRFFPAAL